MKYIGGTNKDFLVANVSTVFARYEPFQKELFPDAYKTLPTATWWMADVKLGFGE